MAGGWGTWVTRITATIGAVLLVAGGGLFVAQSAQAAESTIDDVPLSWRVNDESGGGAFFGGCNFLVAGEVGDNGGSSVWQSAFADVNYKTQVGNVTITKPDSSGNQVQPTWANKCQTANGSNATTAVGSTTGNQVNFDGGTGTVDPDSDSAEIRFKGAFTIVYYGGMTYWSITDPVLSIKNGKGTLSGTASGYGADMFDVTKWVELPQQEIELATLSDVKVTESGIEVTPDYFSVEVDGDDSGTFNPQDRTKEGWGSFPQSWVDYNILTGQSAYWYTSGGLVDPKKPAAPIEVAYTITTGAIPKYDRIPQGLETGLEIGLQELGNVNGTVEARLQSGDEPVALPLHGSSDSPVIANGNATGIWDVSNLEVGSYKVEFHLADSDSLLTDKDGQTIIAEFSVVEWPSESEPQISSKNATHTSISLAWSWTPGVEPPDNYEAAIYEGTSVSGKLVESKPNNDASVTFGTLEPETNYTVKVTPTLATIPGESVTTTIKTGKAPESGGDTGGQSNTDDTTDNNGNNNNGASDGVTFYWGMNMEATGGAYYGGCNFFSAGAAGDTGSSRLWTQGDFQASNGNTTIIKPNSSGTMQTTSWDSKCLDRNGTQVSVTGQNSYTESQVQISNGQVVKNDSSGVRVEWDGSFSVVFYGGLTYWSASNPVLELDANGNGSVTVTASGYGASMHDASKWEKLESETITLADLSGVDMSTVGSGGGFIHTPDYLGVSYGGSGASQGVPGGGDETATGQAARTTENEAIWGSFPSSFVDFQNKTGQFSYWFTSGGQRDPYKPTLPMTVSFSDNFVPTAGDYSGTGSPTLDQTQPNSAVTSPNASADLNASAPSSIDSALESGDVNSAFNIPELLGLPGFSWPEFSLETTPAMLTVGGLGFLGVAGANWAGVLFFRRRLGLDPTAFV
ncbi:MAG: HtaA domain-containing protein [Gulosibacter sp.]|uniref:HtaA domain-containing protein n=1 Tax=Gulosibacter sp. TaxID=2817531 RepID=UPI003F901D8E